MAKKEIKTSILISATPQKVWGILTNFSEYKNWNPFLLSVEGELKVGSQLKINANGMKFKPMVLVANEFRELRWIGKMLFNGVFDGEHIFQIIDNKNGTITFKHEEKFNGFLVGMFSRKLETETRPGFESMNEKLKELAEG